MHTFLAMNLKREKRTSIKLILFNLSDSKKKKKKKKQGEKNLDIMYKHKQRVTLETIKCYRLTRCTPIWLGSPSHPEVIKNNEYESSKRWK